MLHCETIVYQQEEYNFVTIVVGIRFDKQYPTVDYSEKLAKLG